MPRVSQGTRINKKHKQSSLPGKFTVGFVEQLDGREKLVRALKANRDEIFDDIGGQLIAVFSDAPVDPTYGLPDPERCEAQKQAEER